MEKDRFTRAPPDPAAMRRRGAAEALALEALTFIVNDPERLDRFVSLAGLSPDNFRAAAASPGFLAGVLDHMAGDEALLLAFAANRGYDPEDIMHAWTLLDAPPENG